MFTSHPNAHPTELSDPTALTALSDLADALRPCATGGWADDWASVHLATATWLAAQPGLLPTIRDWLRALPPDAAAAIAAGSRETTTHFAWRLAAPTGMPFSFWLHEYKPRREWLAGYANTVHNHRYHFCTTVLAGGYRHEWHDVRLDPRTAATCAPQASSVRLRASEQWDPGPVRSVAADEWHRIPTARDGTVTFLVKSRPVRRHSVSVEPETLRTTRHVPVEERITDLADRI